MNGNLDRLRESALSGMRKGWRSSLWVLRILIPISFLTALLGWSGWIYQIDFLFQPFMSALHLPAFAAVPLLIAMVMSFYGGIAAMSALPFTQDQITLTAIFMLISHSLIQEGIIQGKSGLHPLKATLFRLITAVITVNVVSLFFDSTSVTAPGADAASLSASLSGVLQTWFLSTLDLSLRILVIILVLQTLLEIVKGMGWIHAVIRLLAPILRIFGLRERSGIPWLTGVVFGLIYGSAVIVDEIREGRLTKEETEKLHLSIGINHSFIEDPIILMALGISFFWAWVPRVLAAILSVHLLNLWQRYGRKQALVA